MSKLTSDEKKSFEFVEELIERIDKYLYENGVVGAKILPRLELKKKSEIKKDYKKIKKEKKLPWYTPFYVARTHINRIPNVDNLLYLDSELIQSHLKLNNKGLVSMLVNDVVEERMWQTEQLSKLNDLNLISAEPVFNALVNGSKFYICSKVLDYPSLIDNEYRENTKKTRYNEQILGARFLKKYEEFFTEKEALKLGLRPVKEEVNLDNIEVNEGIFKVKYQDIIKPEEYFKEKEKKKIGKTIYLK